MGILDTILTEKRKELAELRSRKLPSPPITPDVFVPAPGDPLRLICEIKRRSPSAGPLSTVLSVEERARVYERSGASLLSVLCDGPFFDGAYEHLLEARRGTSLPLLCKEFVIDEIQLDAARAYGASAVLLIVRCLTPEALERLVRGARERGLTPLVEVTNEDESRVALDAGATMIGVNARDLDTLAMDAERARRVVESLPDSIVRCHFSGVKTPDDVARVRASGAHAALVGEVLMREDDPSALLGELVASARA